MSDPTYTNIWGFQQFDSVKRNKGEPDDGLITEIHWNLTVESSDNLSATTYGFVTLEKGSTITPFEKLTKKDLISWVKNKLGSTRVVDLEVLLKNNIIEQRNPTSVYGLPSS